MKKCIVLLAIVWNGLILSAIDFTWTEVSRIKENKYYKDGVVHKLGYVVIKPNCQSVTIFNHVDSDCY